MIYCIGRVQGNAVQGRALLFSFNNTFAKCFVSPTLTWNQVLKRSRIWNDWACAVQGRLNFNNTFVKCLDFGDESISAARLALFCFQSLQVLSYLSYLTWRQIKFLLQKYQLSSVKFRWVAELVPQVMNGEGRQYHDESMFLNEFPKIAVYLFDLTQIR